MCKKKFFFFSKLFNYLMAQNTIDEYERTEFRNRTEFATKMFTRHRPRRARRSRVRSSYNSLFLAPFTCEEFTRIFSGKSQETFTIASSCFNFPSFARRTCSSLHRPTRRLLPRENISQICPHKQRTHLYLRSYQPSRMNDRSGEVPA